MSPTLTSHGVVVATVMAVSSTLIFLAFSKQKTLDWHQDSRSLSPNQSLRSCLCPEGKRRQGKKKKRVQFAENVKDTKGNGEEYRREKERSLLARKEREKSNTGTRRLICRSGIRQNPGIPANRAALYNGILKDRVQGMEYSH